MIAAVDDAHTRSARPRWMAGMALFCLLALAVTVPRDLLVEGARDVEVWLGFELRGVWALVTAPLHWLIFATGAWLFWRGDRRVVPWAAGYAFYVALSHLIWSEVSPNGRGWPAGLLQAALLSVPALALLRAARRDGLAETGT